MLRTKSVYSPIDRQRDGLRILATRFLGRYMRSSRYHAWMPSLAPSEYRRELQMNGPIDTRSKTIKNHGRRFTLRLLQRLAKKQNVTIMCHCDED